MPQLIYCDQNCLIDLAAEPQDYQDRLKSVIGRRVRFVMSPWHWVEMASNANEERLIDLAVYAEFLAPMWALDRRSIQRNEVHSRFYSFLGIPYAPPQGIGTLIEAAQDLIGTPIRDGQTYTSVDFARGLWRNREPVLDAHKQNMEARATNLQRRKKQKMPTELMLRLFRRTVSDLLPVATPAGLVIDGESRRKFLEQIQRDDIPTLAVEFAMFEDEVRLGAALGFQSFADAQHVILALPRVDVFVTSDNTLRNRINRIRGRLGFPTAEVATKKELDRSLGLASVQPV